MATVARVIPADLSARYELFCGPADGAATRMGIKRTTLISRMKKLGIDHEKCRNCRQATELARGLVIWLSQSDRIDH